MTPRIDHNTRVLAFDDAPFRRVPKARVRVIGVLSRGALRVEKILSTSLVRDSWGATEALLKLVSEHQLAVQARAILLDGLAFGGFNLVDLPRLASESSLPTIVVMRKPPDLGAIHRALGKLSRPAERVRLVEAAGTIHACARPKLWFQCSGCTPDRAEAVLKASTVEGNYPEPLRLCHLIGAGVFLGSSRGGA